VVAVFYKINYFRTMNYRFWGGLLSVCLLLLLTFHLVWGTVPIALSEVIQILAGKHTENSDIIWQVRLPRAMAGILAGSALAIAGLLMQTFFQNPLAEPSVLGISSGASLGVALWRLGGALGIFSMFWGQYAWALALSAMLGAGLVMALMLSIASYIKSPQTLLLVGIMVGNFAYAFISLLQHFSSAEAVMDFWRWSMGSVAGVTWEQIQLFAPLVLMGMVGSWLMSYTLNSWLLGEAYAQSMGIQVRQVRLQLIVLVSILAGVTTAFCGAIGFIGLAIPAPVRAILRTSRHEILLPIVALAGANTLLLCDIIAKLPTHGSIPLNVMTALIGSPMIIWVIIGLRKTT
jgi:iron complex transport system permease protein